MLGLIPSMLGLHLVRCFHFSKLKRTYSPNSDFSLTVFLVLFIFLHQLGINKTKLNMYNNKHIIFAFYEIGGSPAKTIKPFS